MVETRVLEGCKITITYEIPKNKTATATGIYESLYPVTESNVMFILKVGEKRMLIPYERVIYLELLEDTKVLTKDSDVYHA